MRVIQEGFRAKYQAEKIKKMPKPKKQEIKLKSIKKFKDMPLIQAKKEDLSQDFAYDLQTSLEIVDQLKKHETTRQQLKQFQVNKKQALKVSKKVDFNQNQQFVQFQKQKTQQRWTIISKQLYTHQKNIEELLTNLFSLQCFFNLAKIQKKIRLNQLIDSIELLLEEKTKQKQTKTRILFQILAQKRQQQIKMKAIMKTIYEENRKLRLSSKEKLNYRDEQEVNNQIQYLSQNEFIISLQENFKEEIMESQNSIKEKVEFSNQKIKNLVKVKSEKLQQIFRVACQLNQREISNALRAQSKTCERLMLRKMQTETLKKSQYQEKKECFEVRPGTSKNKNQKINDDNREQHQKKLDDKQYQRRFQVATCDSYQQRKFKQSLSSQMEINFSISQVQRNNLQNLVLKNQIDQFNKKLISHVYKHKLRENNENNKIQYLDQFKEETKRLTSSFISENQLRLRKQQSFNFSFAKIINTHFESSGKSAYDSQKNQYNHQQQFKIQNIQEDAFTNNKSYQQPINCEYRFRLYWDYIFQLFQLSKLNLYEIYELKKQKSEFRKLRSILKFKEDKLFGGGVCGSKSKVAPINRVYVQKNQRDDEITFKMFNEQYKIYFNKHKISEKEIEGHVRRMIENSLYDYREDIIQVKIRHKVIDMINLLINYFLIIRQSKSTQSIQSDINLINNKLETLIIYCKENKERHPCLDLYQYFDILKTLNGQRQGLDEINKSVAAQIILNVIQVAKFGAGFVSIAGVFQNFINIQKDLNEIKDFIKKIYQPSIDLAEKGLESYSNYNSNNIANNMQALWLRKVYYLGDNLSQQDPIQEIMFYLEEYPKIVNKDTQLFVFMQLNYLLSKQQIEDNFQKISKRFENEQKQELIIKLSNNLQVKKYSETILDKIKMIANLIAQNTQFRYIKAQLLLYFAKIFQKTNQNQFQNITINIIANYLQEKEKSVKIIYQNNQIIRDFNDNHLNLTKKQILDQINENTNQITDYLDDKEKFSNFAYKIQNEIDLDKQLAKNYVELWEQSVQQRQKKLKMTHKDDALLEAIHLYVNQQITYQEGYKINTEGRDAVKQIIEQFLIPNFVFSSDDSQNKEESQFQSQEVNQNKCKIISILAEGGSGKSMLLKKLEVELLNRDSEYTKDTRSYFIPFIIKCNSLDRKQPSLEDYLESVKIKRKDIDMLKNSERNKLIMLDGYDEYTGEYFKVYEKLKLNDWVNTLVIVTSRLEKIAISDAKKYFNYYDNQGKQAKNNNSFGIYKLQKITDKDIEDYLEKYQKYSKKKKDFHDLIKEIISKNKQLNKLLELPINLYLISRMIEEIDITDQKISNGLSQVSDQIEIQEFFFLQKFKSQSQIFIEKQQELNLNDNQRQELIEKVQQCYFEYFQLIAMQMFIQKGQKSNYLSTTRESIQFQPSEEVSVLFNKYNLNINSLIQNLNNYIDCKVITRINLKLDAENTKNQSQNNKQKDQQENNKCQEFEFRHKSLFEYFAARAMKYDFDIHKENIYELDIKQLKEFNINKRIIMSNQRNASEQQILLKLYKLMQIDIHSQFSENNYSEQDISKTNKYIQFIKKSTILKPTEKSQIDVGASNLLSALFLSKFLFPDLIFKKCSFSQAYISSKYPKLAQFEECNLSDSFIHQQDLENYETSNTKNAAFNSFQKQFDTEDIYSFKQVIFYKNTLVSITKTGYINQFEISQNKNQPCKKLQSKKITNSRLESIEYASTKNVFIIRAIRSLFEINTQTFETINTFSFAHPISSLAINNSMYLVTLNTQQIFYGDLQNDFILLDENKIQDFKIIQEIKNESCNLAVSSFTSDGKYLAIKINDKICKILNTGNKFKLIQSIDEGQVQISQIAFSPDGKYLAISSNKKTSIFQNKEKGFQLIKSIDEGQNKIVNSIVFSEDGKYFAMASEDNTCKILNVENNFECINTIEGHTDSVSSVAFSADGKYLVTGSQDNTCILWEVKNELQMIHTIKGHTKKISSVAFSANNKYLATGSLDKTCKIWDLDKLQHIKTIEDPTSEICQVAFSPDSKFLATSSYQNTCKIWNVENEFNILKTIQTGDDNIICHIAFSTDGNYLATTTRQGNSVCMINIWKVKNDGFEQLKTIETGHTNEISSLAFSADCKYLASGSHGACNIWNVQDGFQKEITIKEDINKVSSIHFSADSKYLATSSFDDKTCQIWNVENKFKLINKIQGHESCIFSIAFSADGKYLATGSKDKTCKLWNLEQGFELMNQIIGDNNYLNVCSAIFSSDNKYLATVQGDNTCKIWSVENGLELIYTIENHPNQILSVIFSSDGKYLAIGSKDSTCKIWKIKNGLELIKTINAQNDKINPVAFSIDGKYLATYCMDMTCKIWNIENGFKLINTVKDHSQQISSVAFSANYKYLATGSIDKTCKIWNVENNFQLIKDIKEHSKDIYTVDFSSDGKFLVTVSHDCYCKIWNVENKFKLKKKIEINPKSKISVSFSADSKYLITCSYDFTFKIWNTENEFQLIHEIKIDHPQGNQEGFSKISKDCKYLATISLGICKIWNVEKVLKLLNKNGAQNNDTQAVSCQTKIQNIKNIFQQVYQL
ncbi:WD domain, G-beta repeat protein (macronuclear) [Tetrahymena thermophila SB210]|uniref:WD domain, G-beta repeat protein n=1 Tax=Tetrahymena thermophila (strain SB210) TaxID=312017 RepID=Q22D02_TETTS|nr:WD domain, G-beta repeat protein [Tetrahymena thermophila SB210]EAR83187.2 WD domain, G-beta repeat protein [Tetrahymena thermophila SB210]|eukprot:XP_001030850.2 WD domain, G-beta repeat protein [Tetrahymena thermophila SB210]